MNSLISFNIMYIFLAVFTVIFVAALSGLVIATVKVLKGRTKYVPFILSSVVSILIVGASWIFNMGWLRFFMTFLMFPFIHAFVVYIISLLSVKFYDRIPKLKFLNILYLVSYLFINIFLPDGGDYGPMYCFFGLIKNDIFASNAYYISSAAQLVHLVILVLIIVKMIMCRLQKDNIIENQ